MYIMNNYNELYRIITRCNVLYIKDLSKVLPFFPMDLVILKSLLMFTMTFTLEWIILCILIMNL